jgi:CubicO group peptidase (beta-lactamase class C family)
MPLALAISLLYIGVIASATAVHAEVSQPIYPSAHWQTHSPKDAGLDEEALAKVAKSIGGRGCVVRNGYLVYSWGNISKPADVASAAKPVYGHFLFKAIEDGKIKSLDEKVAKYEPGLNDLNKDLGFKDREITWHHMANQVSCYGVTEKPGEAYDYSDYQITLFFDLLFQKVYGTTLKTIDGQVLRPGLADLIGCEDKPTFLAFGIGNRPGRLAISPRDFARFGLLYLRQGRWNDKQLISKEHATMAIGTPLKNAIPRTAGKKAEMLPRQRSIGGGNNQTDHFGSYSYFWWLNGIDRDGKRNWPDAPADAFACLGHGGEHGIIVFPSQDLILSWNDSTISTRERQNEPFKLLTKVVLGHE